MMMMTRIGNRGCQKQDINEAGCSVACVHDVSRSALGYRYG